MIALVLALLAQDPGPLLDRLADDDPAVRQRAVEDLSKLGPGIVPPLLERHRTTASPETKALAEKLLLRHGFAAFARTKDSVVFMGGILAAKERAFREVASACGAR